MSTGAGGESTRWWMQPTQDLFTLQIGFVLDLPIWISPTTSTQLHPSWLFLFCRFRISSGIVENRWFGIFLSKQVQGKPEASGLVKITNFCLKVFLVNAFVYLCFYICIFVSVLICVSFCIQESIERRHRWICSTRFRLDLPPTQQPLLGFKDND